MLLGNYRATETLGSGGFATVYLGEHVRLRRQVAIKILKAHLSQQEQERFLSEAKTLAQLRHPNIVQVLDFGIDDGQPYLVMPYLARGTLRNYYPKGQSHAPELFLPHLEQIASALQYAHTRKIVHRDVKPENMLLGATSEAILTDFGIAVLNQESRMQHRQDVVGTFPYMAPEQIEGLPRRASDQYALAIVTYEWLCGSRPFTSSRAEHIIYQQVHTPPPSLRAKLPELSAAIEAVVLRALSKDPEERYPSVEEFARAFKLVCQSPTTHVFSTQGLGSEPQEGATSTASTLIACENAPTEILTRLIDHALPVVTPPASPVETPALRPEHLPRSRRAFLVAGGSAAALGAAGGVIWFTHTGQSVKSIYLRSSNPQVLTSSSLYHSAGPVDSLSWAPDSKRLVSGTINQAHSAQIWDGTSSYALPYGGPVAWAPSGKLLAACNPANFYLWDTLTGKEQTSSHFDALDSLVSAAPQTLSWSPDGSLLALGIEYMGSIGPGGAIYIWPEGATLRGYYDAVMTLAWANDNTRLAYGTIKGGVFVSMPTTDTEKASLVYASHFDQILNLAWSPDGHSLLIGGSGWPIQLVDAATLQNRTSFAQYNPPLSWSPKGSLAAAASSQAGDYRVCFWNIASGTPVFWGQGHTAALLAVAWSPDGRKLASSSKDGTIRIWSLPASYQET